MEKVEIKLTGIIDSWGYQKSNLSYYLKQNKGKSVLLVVSSLGGDANQALQISKLIEDHGDVTVRLIGCNASAATWMVYGAKSVEIAEDSLILVHQCSNFVDIYKSMKVKDIDAKIKELQSMKKSQEAFNLIIAKKYFSRAEAKGKTFEDVCKLMEEEKWITAADALEWGLVDKLIPGINKMSKDIKNMAVMNCASLNLPRLPFDADETEEPKSMVTQIIDGIKSLLTPPTAAQESDTGAEIVAPGNAPDVTTENNVESTTDNQNQNLMFKKFINLIGLLAIANEALTEEKNAFTLTADQLQQVEDALAAAKTKENSMTEVLNLLDGVSDNIKAMDGAKNKVLALINLVQNFPGANPANPQPPATSDKKDQELKNSAKDPINAEMQSFFRAKSK